MNFRTLSIPVFLLLITFACGRDQQAASDLSQARGSNAGLAEPCSIRFPEHGLCATLNWVELPRDDAHGSFLLQFRTLQGNTPGGLAHPEFNVSVRLWMPMGSGGHDSRVEPVIEPVETAQAERSLPGAFYVSNVFFNMAGAWEIWIDLRDQNNNLVAKAKQDFYFDDSI